MADSKVNPGNKKPGENQGRNQDPADKRRQIMQQDSSVNRGLGSVDEEMQQNLSRWGSKATSRIEDEDDNQ